jgi:hypothetical protein
MSYDLNFWKYKTDTRLDHQLVYERLSNGEYVVGLEDIPVQAIRERVGEEFANDWQQLNTDLWEQLHGNGAFQIYTTAQLFRVDCYGMDSTDMNRLIEIALDFDCRLFDPQVGKRFDENP